MLLRRLAEFKDSGDNAMDVPIPSPVFRFGEYRFDRRGGGLFRIAEDGMRVRVPLGSRAIDLLAVLLECQGEIVSKAEIIAKVWPGIVVEEANLAVQISALRRALGQTRTSGWIQTVAGRGYRFAGVVRLVPPGTVMDGAEADPVGVGMVTRPLTWRVGRAAPLRALGRSLERALDGQRQMVFVTGEAGIGKTTLVDMALEPITRRGAAVLRGCCSEFFGVCEAFLPLIEALEAHCRGIEGPPLVTALRTHAPTWLAQIPALLDDKDRATFQREIFGATRERMLREFCDLIEVMSETRPWVIVLDDLHWSDPATLDLLSRFARRERRASALVIATYRPVDAMLAKHPVGTVHHDLQIRGLCSELALDPLSAPDVRNYLALRFGDRNLADSVGEEVFHRTQGQPLFLVSMIDFWVADGAIREFDGGWRVESEDAVFTRAMPRDLRLMITRQIDRLVAEDQHLLEIASAAGAEFSAAIVAGALGRDTLEVERIFDLIARNGHILVAAGTALWPDGTVSGCFAFKHALYQDVLYQRLAPGRRVQTHRQLGDRLEAAYPAKTAEIAPVLALHFLEGRDFARAVRYLGQAAEGAARRFATREALSYLTRALDIVDRVANSDPLTLRARLLQQRGWLRRSAGDFAGSLDDLNQMISCAVEARQPLLEVSGLVDLSRFCLLFADRRQCLPAAERAPGRSQGLNDKTYQALVAGNAAIINLQLKGWRDEDAEICRRAVIAATGNRDPIIAVRRDGIESILKYLRSEYGDCSAAAKRVKDMAQETGDVFMFGLYNTIESAALIQLGQWRTLRRGVDAALSVAEKNSNVLAGLMCRLVIALLHIEALDFAEGRKRGEETDDLPFETSAWMFFLRRTILAKACVGMRDYPAAEVHLNAVIQKTEIDGFDLDSVIYPQFFNALIEYLLETGAVAPARERAAQLYDFTAKAPDRNYLAVAHRLLAKMALSAGDLVQATDHLAKAVEIVEQSDIPLAAWKVYLSASELYGRIGDPAKAAHYRQRCQARIDALAENFDRDDPLRVAFLAGFAAESARCIV